MTNSNELNKVDEAEPRACEPGSAAPVISNWVFRRRFRRLLGFGGIPPLGWLIKRSVRLPTASRIDIKIVRYLASLMHSRASQDRMNLAGMLAGSLYLDSPGIIVRATACEAPLFLGEMEVEAITTGHPVLLLRHSSDRLAPDLKADIVLPGEGDLAWHLDYHLFRGLAGDSWLVPSGHGPSVQLMRHGLFFSEHSPFSDEWDRSAGLERANAHLSGLLRGGWSW